MRKDPGVVPGSIRLLATSPAQFEPADDLLVSLRALPVEVCEQAPSLTDHLEEPPAARRVVLRPPQVLGQMCDAFGEDRDLHLRRAGVFLVLPELRDHFAFGSERHPSFLSLTFFLMKKCT